MKTKEPKSTLAAIAGWFALGATTAMPAQTPAALAAGTAPEQTVQLTAFEVASTRDSGYRATNSVSGTRVNAKLMDVPQTVSVLTSDFIQDIGATDLDEALIYTSGVGTAGFFAGQYTIRGFQTGTPRRNGISFTTSNAIDAAVVDRVEVVKGPRARSTALAAPAASSTSSPNSRGPSPPPRSRPPSTRKARSAANSISPARSRARARCSTA